MTKPTKDSWAGIELDVAGKPHIFVMTDAGKHQLSAEQQDFLTAAAALDGPASMAPGESVSFVTDGDRLAALLGWEQARLRRVGLELEELGVISGHSGTA